MEQKPHHVAGARHKRALDASSTDIDRKTMIEVCRNPASILGPPARESSHKTAELVDSGEARIVGQSWFVVLVQLLAMIVNNL